MVHDGSRESWERHPHAVPHELVKPVATPVPTAQAQPPREPPQKFQFGTYNATVTKMETHHSGLWEIDFSLDKPMPFTAGQYVSIYLPGMKPAPFSIASSPLDERRIVLGVEVVGKVTTAMSQFKPGDVVTMKGPFGKFVMEEGERKVCFLAGGIGITPFISMMRWIRDTRADKEAVLFYTCKNRDQFMWFDELAAMEREGLRTVFTLTQERPEGWTHRLGRISEAMLKEELPDYKEYVFFSCGPPGLIDAMFQLLEGMGVPKEHLRREAWH